MLSAHVQTADFNFELPVDLIAQTPATQRDGSRLMVLDRHSGHVAHRHFRDLIDYVQAGDVLVLNNSRVVPARLRGANVHTGGQFEVLLLEENDRNDWWVMMRPGKRARVGTRIAFRDPTGSPATLEAVVTETNAEGHRRLRFSGAFNVLDALDTLGEVPLPPYIARNGAGPQAQDRERYQTVYAKPAGSVAAPTAGLHFTERLLDSLRGRGVEVHFVTLHVGLGTFAPVKAQTLAAHTLHEERYQLSATTAAALTAAKRDGRRVIAVGTTSVRVLESVAAGGSGALTEASGRTRIFIYPPYRFRVVDALLTNFHLPCSTLLMLVSAFASPGDTRGREQVLAAYSEAVHEQYRFFSYGDAMLIL